MADSAVDIIEKALKNRADKNSVNLIEKEIEKLEAKKEKLLDMCLSGDIETSEYKKASERLNAEHLEISVKLKIIKENTVLIDRPQILKNANSIITGEAWDDIFYRSLVDKIIVYKDRTADVYMKLIPYKWRAKILKGKAEIDQYPLNRNNLSNAGASVPISVSVALSSGRGIVNR